MKKGGLKALIPVLGVLAGGLVMAGLGSGDGAQPRAVGVSPIRKLKITFETSRRDKAGTDADIYVAVSYKTPSEGGGEVFRLPTHKYEMERGQTNSYATCIPAGNALDGKDVDQISAITVINGMNRGKPGWHVASVEVKAYGGDGHTYLLASSPVNRWLDSNEADGPALCVPLRAPFADLGAGDLVGATDDWHTKRDRTGPYDDR